MKLLIVDMATTGHHTEYLRGLVPCEEAVIVILPQKIDLPKNCILYICNEKVKGGTFFAYFRWIKFIRTVAEKEKVDVIHIATGDFLLKFFGIFFNKLKASKRVVITFHHFVYSPLRNYSRKRIIECCFAGVVHTNELLYNAQTAGINNCVKIEYPQFMEEPKLSQAECRKYFGILDDGVPVLAAIGGTRYDKGLDILLTALKQKVKQEIDQKCKQQEVKQDFYLLIAGVEDFFTEDFIIKETASYRTRVFTYLQYLTNLEFMYAVKAADFILVPYRKQFDGASGPLVAGVSLGKAIIGSGHGSLGEIIRTKHLGYTFKSEDVTDLALTIHKAISAQTFTPDEVYKGYQNELNLETFKEKYRALYQKIVDMGKMTKSRND